MMHLSSLPILIIVIFGFLTFLTLGLQRFNRLNALESISLYMLFIILLVWGGCSGYLSSSGVYVSIDFLRLAPGYWLPYIPVITTVVLVVLITSLQNALRKFVDYVPDYWLTGIHMLRILALGSIIKATMGVFPEKFAWFVGVPDLLFGLSAIPITLLARRKQINDNFLILWHISGALVIIVPAVGLMHIFMNENLFSELFVFPMVLAPTLVVPMLVMLNLLVVWRLMEKIVMKSKNVNQL